MQRERRPIRSPEQPSKTAVVPQPADVYFSRSWRYLIGSGVIGGLLLVWQRRWATVAALGFGIGALWHYMRHREPAHPRIMRHTLATTALAPAFAGFTIAQISDVHLGQPYSDANLAWTIRRIAAARPDLVVITGDIVNDRPALTRVAHALQQLSAPCGVYAIPGNHDYVEDIEDVVAALAFCGVRMLRNEGVTVQHNGAALWLAGVDDVWHGRRDIAAAVAAAPPGVPIVLLAHAPDDGATAAADPRIILQLSGHVHGGHIRLPVFGPLAAPRYGRRYTHGVYQIDGLRLVVSLGLGGRQARLGNRPELNLYQFSPAERTPA